MPDNSYTLRGFRIFECAREGPQLRNDRDAVQLIGSAASAGLTEWLLIPTERFDSGFFRPSTRIAGEILQKFVTYGRRVAIIGDISAYVSESSALRDFVYECNRGNQIWFVPSAQEFEERLAQQSRPKD